MIGVAVVSGSCVNKNDSYAVHEDSGNRRVGVTVCVTFVPGIVCGGAYRVPPFCHEIGINHSLVVKYTDKLSGTVYLDHVTVDDVAVPGTFTSLFSGTLHPFCAMPPPVSPDSVNQPRLYAIAYMPLLCGLIVTNWIMYVPEGKLSASEEIGIESAF